MIIDVLFVPFRLFWRLLAAFVRKRPVSGHFWDVWDPRKHQKVAESDRKGSIIDDYWSRLLPLLAGILSLGCSTLPFRQARNMDYSRIIMIIRNLRFRLLYATLLTRSGLYEHELLLLFVGMCDLGCSTLPSWQNWNIDYWHSWQFPESLDSLSVRLTRISIIFCNFQWNLTKTGHHTSTCVLRLDSWHLRNVHYGHDCWNWPLILLLDDNNLIIILAKPVEFDRNRPSYKHLCAEIRN